MRGNHLAGLALAAGMLASVAYAADRPNVVFILADDQAWTDYGFMGHETIATPHLDRLAKESRVYMRGYVPSSLCRPSLMTLVTGKYPHEHGVTGNDPPKGTPRDAMLKFVREQPTVPRLLSAASYRTFQSGKWWEGSYKDGGFTHGMTHGDPQRGGRHGDDGLKIGRAGLQPIFDFIEASGETPFFVWYAPLLPHQPHNPPARLLAKYRDKVESLHVAKYYAMCEWWDETCGELLDYLDQKKLRDNTLVIYVCDNGWIQDPEKPTFDARSKRSPYDAGLRTPIMIRWPDKVKPALTETPVSTLRIAETILDACNVDRPSSKKERGSLLVDQPAGPLFGEIFEHDVVDLDAPRKSLLYRWVLSDNMKLIVPNHGKPAELYDVQRDPHERKNLADAHPEVIAELRQKVDAWWPGK
jgi:arylsulfatase A-like enzyme